MMIIIMKITNKGDDDDYEFCWHLKSYERAFSYPCGGDVKLGDTPGWKGLLGVGYELPPTRGFERVTEMLLPRCTVGLASSK